MLVKHLSSSRTAGRSAELQQHLYLQIMAVTTTNGSNTTAFFFFLYFFFFLTLTSGSLPTLPSVLAPSAPMIAPAPSYHPDTPKFPAEPPALSPDIMPVFPSPRRGSADGLPTIPSSQSPPNPDLMDPDSAFAPFGSSSSAAAMSTGDAPSEMKSCVGWLVSGAATIFFVRLL